MKRIFCVLFTIVLIVGMLSTSALAAGEPTIQVSTVDGAKPGDTVSVTVDLQNNPGVASFLLTVSYDASKLEWTNVTQGSMGGNWDIAVNEMESWVNTANYTEDGTILTLEFKVLEGAVGTAAVSVSYDDGDIFNANEEDINFAVVSGSVNIAEAVHSHEWGNWAKSDDTQHKRICKTDSSHEEFADHTWGKGEIETEATCEKDGTMVYSCTVCGAKKSESIAALGHDLVSHDAKAATCTEKGWEAYETCRRCDYSTYKEIAALGHDLVSHDAKAATCTEKGWEAYETCRRCDYSTYKEIASLGHSYVNAVVLPTCTTGGYTTHTCSRCDNKYSDSSVAALGHSYDKTVVAPTCTSKGYTEYTCTRCQTSYRDSETPTVSHTWDDGVITKEATQKEDGEKTFTCAVCGEVMTEIIDKLPEPTSGTCGDNLTWSLEDGVLTIKGTGKMKDYPYPFYNSPWFNVRHTITAVVIEDGVTSIGDSVFFECSSLMSITIPDGITSIGDGAFESCTSLTSITIPDSVTSIGGDAFYDCSSLTVVIVPESVTNIDVNAFAQCKALTEITILNPQCVIVEGKDMWGSDALTVYGYTGSTAEEYADIWGHNFVSLGVVTVLGDVVGDDGVVDLKDVTKLFQYVNKQIDESGIAMAAADINGDGNVDLKDVTKLFQFVNKQIASL